MAHAPNYANYYKKMEINTAGPFELILILYRGTIDNLKSARRHFDQGNIEQRVLCLNRAVGMIGELQSALDFERGKEIASHLGRLYSYMQGRLIDVNLKRQPEALDEVAKLLEILKSAWEGAQPRSAQQADSQLSGVAAR